MAKSFFKFFLLFVFVLGIFFLLNNKVIPGSYPSKKDSFVNVENTDCPDMLIRKDNALLLYNSNKPKEAGKNPKIFRNLDEYINHLEVQRSKGIKCPVLFLQSEVNAQGEEVYRMRPSPFDMQGGTQLSNNIYNRLDRDGKGNIVPLDATRDRNPYNKNNYPGFDSHNLHMGQFTTIDGVHTSTINGLFSENPMDKNWGGVEYTQDAVDSGKYKDREVKKPYLSTPYTTYHKEIPSMYNPPQDRLE